MKEHAKYGKPHHIMRPMPFCFAPQLIVGLGLFAGGAAWLGVALSKGKAFPVLALIFLIAGILVAGYCIYSLTKCGIFVYDDAVIVREGFKQTVMEKDDIRAMFWSFPGANDYNSRAPRKNNTTCEFILKGGRKSCKVSDAFYKNMEPPLSRWQSDNKIAKDL